MQWLQNLDVDLFRFVNGTLSNPVFDKVMPFVSGNVLFVPGLVVLATIIIWKERERGLAFVLMLALVVGTNDGLICRNIKHAVGRPRPFSVLPDVNRPETKSTYDDMVPTPAGQNGEPRTVERKRTAPANPHAISRGSMPSAHAANWFAGTVVALIYYRKSLRFMLPAACVVSFSRVYNGVHYPSDVLVGAIIGAGHAAATVWVLESLWQWSGPRWFAAAWRAMPSLVAASSRPQESELPRTG